jgi:hypothetical protein
MYSCDGPPALAAPCCRAVKLDESLMKIRLSRKPLDQDNSSSSSVSEIILPELTNVSGTLTKISSDTNKITRQLYVRGYHH